MIDPARVGLDAQEIAEIRAQMQAAVDSGHLPGALLLVGNREGIGLLETVGTQGPGDTTPIDAQTIFRIYSMTKPIVSVAAMDMVEDGLLSVSDPVSKWSELYHRRLCAFCPDAAAGWRVSRSTYSGAWNSGIDD